MGSVLNVELEQDRRITSLLDFYSQFADPFFKGPLITDTVRSINPAERAILGRQSIRGNHTPPFAPNRCRRPKQLPGIPCLLDLQQTRIVGPKAARLPVRLLNVGLVDVGPAARGQFSQPLLDGV